MICNVGVLRNQFAFQIHAYLNLEIRENVVVFHSPGL